MNTPHNAKTMFALSSGILSSLKTESIDLTENQLILVTPAGTMTGTFVSSELEEELKDDISFNFMKQISNNASKNCSNSQDVILLKDVSLVSSNVNQFFKYLFVFTEDIIAISLGSISIED